MNKLNLFFSITKKQWLYLSLGFLLSVLTVIASVGLLSVAGFLICGAALAGATGAAATFNYLLPATVVRFFALLRITGRYGERILTHDATFRMLKDLRIWFYKILEPLAPAHLLLHQSGDLLNRMIRDVDALDKIYLRLLIPFFSSVLLVILTGIFLYFFNPALSLWLTVFLLIGIIVIPFTAYYLGKNPSIIALKTVAKLRIHFIEFSGHLMDLILYGKARSRVKHLLLEQVELMQQQKKQAFIRGLVNALISLLTSVSLLMVLLICVPLVNTQQLAPANLGLLALLIFAIFEAINVLPQACQYIGETALAGNRIYELALIKPTVQFPDSTILLNNFDLKFDNISFHYPNHSQTIFKDFSLTIPFGNHLAVIGSTGVGKSTLAYLAVRCFDPVSGDIYLGENSLKKYSENQLRDIICYVTQNSHLFNTSIRDNLLLAKPAATDAELYAALDLVKLKDEVAALPTQLASTMGEFGKHFSGGQIRRFALARAILKSAPITILDEPLEGVDDITSNQIFANLQQVFLNKTLIVITHQLTHLPQEFQRIRL